MTKPINAQEILAALPPEAREDFKQQLKHQGGVEVTFTVSKTGRKRKHRWASAKGTTISIRVSPEEKAKWTADAHSYLEPHTRKPKPMTLSQYCAKILRSEAGRHR